MTAAVLRYRDPFAEAACVRRDYFESFPGRRTRPDAIEFAEHFGLLVVGVRTRHLKCRLGGLFTEKSIEFIAVRLRLASPAEQFAIAHQLGHVVLRIRGVQLGAYEERWCDLFAAALLADAVPVWVF